MSDTSSRRGSVLWRCLALALFSALIYFPGLTNHGLTNWQESVRLVVAREMHERDAWLVPTRNAEPYLAKPPMIYWVQRGFASLRGDAAFTSEFELRATVALFGVLGVVATFLTARALTRDDTAAWWSALTLAVGVLYVRSSRIGELDVLLVPFVVTAVGALVTAWQSDRTRWGLLALATLAATGATLTKGPPALLTIAIGGVVSAIAWGTCETRSTPGRGTRLLAGSIGAAALVGLSVRNGAGMSDAIGVVIFAIIGSGLAVALVTAVRPAPIAGWWPLVRRAQPWFVLGIPVLAFLGWGRLVAQQIGRQKLAELAQTELDDNLRILVAESPVNNLGFITYGVAPLGVLGLLALLGMIARRQRPSAGVFSAAVWLVVGFVAFSTLGKGVARYLTPLWPSIAVLAGWWIAAGLAQCGGPARRKWKAILTGAVILSGVGQLWWYADGRERYHAPRSGRALAAELPKRFADFDPTRFGTYYFESPDLEYYFDEPIEEWGKAPKRLGLDRLRSEVEAAGGTYILLVREQKPEVLAKYGDAREQLREAGILVIEVMDLGGIHVQPPDATPIDAWRLSADVSGGNP